MSDSYDSPSEVRMADPIPTYGYLVKQLAERFPDLAFLDVLEPGINGTDECGVLGGEVSCFSSCRFHTD